MGGITKALFGGSDSKSSSQQQSSSQLDPRLFDIYNQNLNRASGVANNLGVRQFADYAPDYNSGADMLRNTVTNQQGLNTVRQGSALAGQAGNYNPLMVDGGSFLNANMQAYMNPFLQNVAGNTINDMYRARQMQGMGDNYAATQAGAFGGSRHGIAEAETNRNFYDRLGSTLGNLYSTGYDTASQMAMSDLDRALAAQQSNQNAGLTTNEQRLSAADSLGRLGVMDQEMGLQGSQAMMNLGLGQQEFNQAQLDAIRNLPLEQQAIINEALGINPAGGSGMTSSSSGTSASKSDSQNGVASGIGSIIGAAMFLSDERAKENIKPIGGALAKLKEIDGMEYNYLNSPDRTAGVMAQDVERVMPGAVADVGMKMVNYPEVTGLLVEAVKELAKKQKKRG